MKPRKPSKPVPALAPTRTSARNVFHGAVRGIVTGPVNDEITLALPSGDELVAVITHQSTRELGLVVGGPVTAIVKAPWVVVATGGDTGGLAARNQLHGRVAAITPGPVQVEVAIALPGGSTVRAVITADAARELGLAVGRPATAILKASQVVLAA